jgi:hypothetical protein
MWLFGRQGLELVELLKGFVEPLALEEDVGPLELAEHVLRRRRDRLLQGRQRLLTLLQRVLNLKSGVWREMFSTVVKNNFFLFLFNFFFFLFI